MIKLKLPLDPNEVKKLRAGDSVLLSGSLYTGRDAAHKKIVADIEAGKSPVFDISGQLIYYVGPAPASPGHAVGPAGPTTSYRMDAYTPLLLKHGLLAMMGKGLRNEKVIAAIKERGGVYLASVGGAAALLARHIKKSELVAYPELGPEAVYKFEVEDFPAVVVIDSLGTDLYKTGPQAYIAALKVN